MRVIRLNLSRRLSEFSRLLFLGVVPLRGGRVDHEARPVALGFIAERQCHETGATSC